MDGVINVYKPKGITSFDVVRTIRKTLKVKKVGHTGTLDPIASGVLPVCIGKSTKIVDYIMKDTKTYRALFKLGIETDTYDREGKVLYTSNTYPDENTICEEIKSFIGEIDQIPPMYSAIKVNGQKLYDLARKGVEIERSPRKIIIYDITIKSINIPFIDIVVTCSKGTYIRSLCNDIGKKLNCGASMWELERLASGIFKVEDSVKLEDISIDNIDKLCISTEECLINYPIINVSEKFHKLLINGVRINDPTLVKNATEDTIYRVYANNNFIGLGKNEKGTFKMIKLLS